MAENKTKPQEITPELLKQQFVQSLNNLINDYFVKSGCSIAEVLGVLLCTMSEILFTIQEKRKKN